MSYYTTGTSISRVEEVDLGLVVTAHTEHVGKVIQCYVAGELAAWQRPEHGTVRFVLQQVGPHDAILLLAVDTEGARTNYWPQAWAASDRHGNRICVSLRRDLLDGWRPGDRWRVYRGEAGDEAAAILVHETDIHPGGRGATGWGFGWGHGGWGYSGCNAPGWGCHWGYTWGFGVDSLQWTSDPLPRGTYPVKALAVDEHGNESGAHETTVVVDTYARPAGSLAVSSYAKATDALVLSMVPSEDIA